MKLKKYLILLVLFVFTVICISYPFRHRIKRIIKGVIEHYSPHNRSKKSVCPNCDKIFVDNVKKQEQAYIKEGIKPQKNKEGLKKLLRLGKLKTVKTNEFYIIDNLTHSSPYLMPKAILFLNDLSQLYNNKCIQKGIRFVPFKITSLTRTTTDVEKLIKKNENAISNSSHLKGKTFDVNYRSFNHNKEQTICFISALSELRNKKRCYAKYESNGCLHITVN